MITKAIIVDKDKNKYKVRIPILDGVESSANGKQAYELNWATLASSKGLSNPLSIGDKVIIGFEQKDYSRPIIIGLLYLEGNETSNNDVDASFRLLKVSQETILGEDTYIGKVRPKDLQNLTNTKANLQFQIDEINNWLLLGQYTSANLSSFSRTQLNSFKQLKLELLNSSNTVLNSYEAFINSANSYQISGYDYDTTIKHAIIDDTSISLSPASLKLNIYVKA